MAMNKAKDHSAFPCNIPAKKPGHATLALENAWTDMYQTVSARMEKLRKVVDILGENEDLIAHAIQKAFCDNDGVFCQDDFGNLLLDDMSAQEIADTIKSLLPIIQWQPFVRFPNAIPVVNCMFVTNSEWVLIRCMGFGGSDSAIVAGIQKYESASERTLYHSKTTLPNTDNDAGKAFIFAFGHIKEPLVIRTFCQKTGARQLPCPFLYQSADHPYMTANIDAIVELPNKMLAVFEAKTSGGQNYDTWSTGVPQQYLRQPIQYMAVLNDDRIECAYIGCILANNLESWFCHRIDRDLVAEQQLIQYEEEFFNTYIVPGVIPDFSGKVKNDLFAYFTYEKEKKEIEQATNEEELAEEFKDRLEIWQALSEEAKKAEAKMEAAKSQMEQIAAELYTTLSPDTKTGYQFCDDGAMMFTVSCRVTKRTKIDGDTLKLLYPDIYAKVAEETISVSNPSISRKKIPARMRKLVNGQTV